MNSVKTIYSTIGLCVLSFVAHGKLVAGERAEIERVLLEREAENARLQADIIDRLRAEDPTLYQRLSNQALERATTKANKLLLTHSYEHDLLITRVR